MEYKSQMNTYKHIPTQPETLEHGAVHVPKVDAPVNDALFLHRVCSDCTAVPPHCSPTSNHALPKGRSLRLGWTFFCENNTYSALGYKVIHGTGHITANLMPLPSVNRIQGLSLNCEDAQHLCPISAAIATAWAWTGCGNAKGHVCNSLLNS